MIYKIFYPSYRVYFNSSLSDFYNVIFILIVVVAIVVFWFLKKERKEEKKDFENYLSTLDSFEIDLDDIKIDGFEYKESVAVDHYGNEMNFKGEYQSSIENYHKDEDRMRYYSLLYIPIKYKQQEKEYKVKLLAEDATIKIKFYLQKKATVYVTQDSQFIIDFTFFENENISYIYT